MIHPNVGGKNVYKKGFVIKTVTPEMLRLALESEDKADLKEFLTFVWHDGEELKIPLTRGMYWVFYVDTRTGETVDYYSAFDDEAGFNSVHLWKEFGEHMGVRVEVYFISRDKGLEKIL